jgi:hypothetical protein
MRSTETEVRHCWRSKSLHGSIADCAGVVGTAIAFETVNVTWLTIDSHSIVIGARPAGTTRS